MALTAGNKPLASDFISLKQRVKKEMQRRNLTNPLTAYAGTAYDYTTTPAAGGKLLAEHIEKIIVPINAIKSTGFAAQQDGLIIKALNAVDVQLSAHEVKPLRGSGTDCTAGCSGLCTNACTGTCQGTCSGTCSGGCKGCTGCTNCSGTCSGGCKGCTSCSGCSGCTSCSGCSGCSNCSGTCSGGCSSGCTDRCKGCGAGCATGCGEACSTGCSGGCKGGCTRLQG